MASIARTRRDLELARERIAELEAELADLRKRLAPAKKAAPRAGQS